MRLLMSDFKAFSWESNNVLSVESFSFLTETLSPFFNGGELITLSGVFLTLGDPSKLIINFEDTPFLSSTDGDGNLRLDD